MSLGHGRPVNKLTTGQKKSPTHHHNMGQPISDFIPQSDRTSVDVGEEVASVRSTDSTKHCRNGILLNDNVACVTTFIECRQTLAVIALLQCCLINRRTANTLY